MIRLEFLEVNFKIININKLLNGIIGAIEGFVRNFDQGEALLGCIQTGAFMPFVSRFMIKFRLDECEIIRVRAADPKVESVTARKCNG